MRPDPGCSSPGRWSKFGALQNNGAGSGDKEDAHRKGQHGRDGGAGGCALCGTNPARRAELPDIRPADARAVHSCGMSDQGRGRARERRPRSAGSTHCRCDSSGGGKGPQRRPRRPVSDRRISDRLGHQHQHERKRSAGHPCLSYGGHSGESERSRQHEPEFERRHSYRHSSVGGAGGVRISAAGADPPRRARSKRKPRRSAALRRRAART